MTQHHLTSRLAVTIALAGLANCGGSSPTQPTPPTPPPPARLEMVAQALQFGPSPDGWRITATGQNTGAGCAVGVSGVLAIRDVTETTQIGSWPWSFDAGRIITPGSAFAVEACCMSAADFERLRGVTLTYALGFRWKDVRCQ